MFFLRANIDMGDIFPKPSPVLRMQQTSGRHLRGSVPTEEKLGHMSIFRILRGSELLDIETSYNVNIHIQGLMNIGCL